VHSPRSCSRRASWCRACSADAELSELETDIVETYAWNTTEVKCPPSFWCYIGMVVVVTKNIAQHLGVVNGARGRIKRLLLAEDCVVTQTSRGMRLSKPPVGVVVEFETPTPGGAIDGFGPKERVVFAQRETGTAPFNGKKPPKRGPKPAGVHFDYTALPLRCGLASTIHSAQGLTLWFGVIIGDLFGHDAALGARRRAVTRQGVLRGPLPRQVAQGRVLARQAQHGRHPPMRAQPQRPQVRRQDPRRRAQDRAGVPVVGVILS